ncbi:MAG: hypothetical protein EWV80_00185 [Microcystis aeruginosa Ma_QC_B_20070730_S2]|uniref:Tyr recombinase domain-containing protein n=1 Tax=Microcystis aeruginosa Ma_QC_B_20070730_S2 TaxID=2486256 RepID=A0A552EB53_MICAE|nr:MAG: hypothetical protein EWV80_00185 [Microcystis aeruginosa Ma_QC_B_20070730_S2]
MNRPPFYRTGLIFCNRTLNCLKGVRDAAILRLLWDNALRRAEVCSLDLEDYSSGDLKLLIKGKGKLTRVC